MTEQVLLDTETEFADLDFSSAFQFCFYAWFNLKITDPSAFFLVVFTMRKWQIQEQAPL